MFSEEDFLKESNDLISFIDIENTYSPKSKKEVPCIVFYKKDGQWVPFELKISRRDKGKFIFESVAKAKLAISNRFCFAYKRIKFYKDQELFRKRFYKEYFKFVKIDINKINPND